MTQSEKSESARSDSPKSDSAKYEIAFHVNGESKTVQVYPMERLLDVLRHELQLTGTKEGCGEGECGSCSVLIDGALVNSCLVPVMQVDGAKIATIEGLADREMPRRVQQTFLECGGAQCGICTPGMIMAAVQLLEKRAHPTMEDVREGLSGNLCRCTGYMQIFEAVFEAAGHGNDGPRNKTAEQHSERSS